MMSSAEPMLIASSISSTKNGTGMMSRTTVPNRAMGRNRSACLRSLATALPPKPMPLPPMAPGGVMFFMGGGMAVDED